MYDSVSRWIIEMKNGDEDAVQRLWDRYVRRITGLAKRRLAGQPKRVKDEEDVVQSVFRSLCLGAADGEFPNLTHRDDLWPLLARITNRKAANQIRWENRVKRGGGKVQGESALHGQKDELGGFANVAGDVSTPEFDAEMSEQCQRLLDALPDDTYRFVIWKRLEGYTNDEIADVLNVTTRSVERKIQNTREMLARKSD